MSHPYRELAERFASALRDGRDMPLGGFPPAPRPDRAADAPCCLMFSPHPDDECIVGALPLRLLREARWRVVNVAVTQGSRVDRREARWRELAEACAFLGFECVATREGGLEGIRPETKSKEPACWANAVACIVEKLEQYRPSMVVCPHDDDWNSTHIGTHALVMDALKARGDASACRVLLSEYWGAMRRPNLMVESTADDVGDLMAATSFHVGEVERNPYHVRQPAWMQDNVRRGGELVGGQGGAAPDFVFATLYRLLRWTGRAWEPAHEGGRVIAATDALPDAWGGGPWAPGDG